MVTELDHGPREVNYRPVRKEDWPFIYHSWVRSYSKSPYAGSITRGRLVKAVRATIDDLAQREHFNVQVASCPAMPDQIWGYVAYETDYEFPLLHFCYVRELFRGMRFGSDLVALARAGKPGVMHYTFRTPACRKFLRGAKFRPNLARRKPSGE